MLTRFPACFSLSLALSLLPSPCLVPFPPSFPRFSFPLLVSFPSLPLSLSLSLLRILSSSLSPLSLYSSSSPTLLVSISLLTWRNLSLYLCECECVCVCVCLSPSLSLNPYLVLLYGCACVGVCLSPLGPHPSPRAMRGWRLASLELC